MREDLALCSNHGTNSPTKLLKMADQASTLKLLRAKVIASGCMKKIEAIVQIKDTWDFVEEEDDNFFERIIIDIGLECEYAISNFDAIVDLSEQLLRNPPTYGANPDERRHRLLELQVLGNQARRHANGLWVHLGELKGEANEGALERLTEAERRAYTVNTDSAMLEDSTKRLCEEG